MLGCKKKEDISKFQHETPSTFNYIILPTIYPNILLDVLKDIKPQLMKRVECFKFMELMASQ
jgi:hypothetical protein